LELDEKKQNATKNEIFKQAEKQKDFNVFLWFDEERRLSCGTQFVNDGNASIAQIGFGC
jgi:hypothetical protein